MGKAKLQRLLEQLDAVQAADRENAAAIYTVATIAVQQLEQVAGPVELSPTLAIAEQSGGDLAQFKQQFESYQDCRRQLKAQGLSFGKTPTWQQLYDGWQYLNLVLPALTNALQTQPLPAAARLELKLDRLR